MVSEKSVYSEAVNQSEDCHPYVTTMKTTTFQDDTVLIPNRLVFHLTSLQNATENCLHSVLVREPLKPELIFTFQPEHVTELFVVGEQLTLNAAIKIGVTENKYQTDGVAFQQPTNRCLHSSIGTLVPCFHKMF